MVDYYPHGFADRFSDRIIPVFLGLTMAKDTLSKEEVNYLKKYEPIGCRDERTLNTMRKYGIISYLHGCITVTFPKRKEGNYKSVYVVDVDKCFIIPDEIKQNAQYRTHFSAAEDPKSLAQKQYQEYIDNASLVITSLLHCAVPCLAAGIPVVLLKTAVSYRMSWLEKLLPIYTPGDTINWNPTAPNIEQHKEKVLALTIRRLQDAYEKYAGICDLSYFYENRTKHKYVNDALESIKNYIDQNWQDLNGFYEYSIWGLTQTAECIVDYIGDKYKNAKLCHVYDAFRKEQFRGILCEPPDNMKQRPNETVFATWNGADEKAFKKFNVSKYAMFVPVK